MALVRLSLMLAMITPVVLRASPQSIGATEAAQQSNAVVVAQIKQMEHDRIEAGVRKDIAAIAAVTADGYVQIDWDGRILDKAATLARIKSSDIKLQSNTVDDMEVRVHADTAVVVGTATRKGVLDGKDISGTIRYTRVYVNRNGRWQVIQFQQTRIAQAP
jgi:ketosteroid isomerase-like protein